MKHENWVLIRNVNWWIMNIQKSTNYRIRDVFHLDRKRSMSFMNRANVGGLNNTSNNYYVRRSVDCMVHGLFGVFLSLLMDNNHDNNIAIHSFESKRGSLTHRWHALTADMASLIYTHIYIWIYVQSRLAWQTSHHAHYYLWLYGHINLPYALI